MPLSLFESTIFQEAPGDPEPEATAAPPDIPEDTSPPEIGEDPGDAEAPPDIPEMDFGADDVVSEGEPGDDPAANLEVGDKVSVAMNYRLYQRFLTLLNTVSSQLETIKSNSDMILAVSAKALDVIEPLGKLGENIRLYLVNSFLDTNYSRNLLFYNKCLNLLNLLNDIFRAGLKTSPESK